MQCKVHYFFSCLKQKKYLTFSVPELMRTPLRLTLLECVEAVWFFPGLL